MVATYWGIVIAMEYYSKMSIPINSNIRPFSLILNCWVNVPHSSMMVLVTICHLFAFAILCEGKEGEAFWILFSLHIPRIYQVAKV